MRLRQTKATLLIAAIALLATACAAHTFRDKTRVGAVTLGEAVHAVDAAEREVAAANVPGYDQTARAKVNAAILRLATAEKAYAQAARSWQTGQPVPETLAAARVGVEAALTTLADALPAVDAVRGPILKAIDIVRAALAEAVARHEGGPLPVQAALPLSLPAILSLVQLIASLVESGRSDLGRIKSALQKEGATDEELDAVIADMDAVIARRSQPPAEG